MNEMTYAEVELKAQLATQQARIEVLTAERDACKAEMILMANHQRIDNFQRLLDERDRLRGALEDIARYDDDSQYGQGICPYGCDTPNIAQAALRGEGG